MPSDFVANGVDLDDIFAPYVSGAKADLTYLTVGGVDLKDRYQKYTAGAKAAVTYFTDTGVDLKDIFAPIGFGDLALDVDPNPIYGYDGTDGPGSVSAGGTATATGGTGPYTYAWTYVSGSAAITIDNAAVASPIFTFTAAGLAGIRFATWRCTVTDALAATAYVDVPISLQRGGEPP